MCYVLHHKTNDANKFYFAGSSKDDTSNPFFTSDESFSSDYIPCCTAENSSSDSTMMKRKCEWTIRENARKRPNRGSNFVRHGYYNRCSLQRIMCYQVILKMKCTHCQQCTTNNQKEIKEDVLYQDVKKAFTNQAIKSHTGISQD